ncbi:MAG: type IX secretion system sortase PorU [Bacteroidales bacterium]|nr:type IX secretion system sortase PorU [Bacteroidales bacterium]
MALIFRDILMIRQTFLLIILMVMVLISSFAQKTISQSIAIQWDIDPYEDNETQYPHFYGADYLDEFGKIPLFHHFFSVDQPALIPSIEILNPIFIPLMHESLLTNFEKKLISDSLQWSTQTRYELFKTGVGLQIMPYRKNVETGLLEQLYYAEVKISFIKDSTNELKNHQQELVYPEKSPLADGDWFKISVSSNGVYKISGADLKNAGMDISSVQPRQLKLLGNGGGMIPEDNSWQKFTCLQENAIVVVGEEDGVFNESDYILFYGESPNVWRYDSVSQTFFHQIHYYSQQNYYYIGVNDGDGKRIQIIDNQSLEENFTTNVSDFYDYFEEELYNPSNGGKTWYGKSLNSIENSVSYSVNIPNLQIGEPVQIRTGLASQSNSTTSFKVLDNTSVIQTVSFSNDISYKTTLSSFIPSSSSFSLQFLYQNSSGSNGWLDYYEILAKKHLSFTGGQMMFRDKNSIGAGRVTRFSISNTTNTLKVWNVSDVTNVYQEQLSVNNAMASFKTPTETIQQFIAFDGTSFREPTIVGRIENQNLTGLRGVQSVIVAPSEFLDLAQTLASHHREELGINTIVVTPQQVYNEFSSGKPDIGAIRDFMRMLYKTAQPENAPKYLLFYGNGTYDYKNIQGNNNNYLPTWTSNSVTKFGKSGDDREYSTDDFFGFLDDDEGGMVWGSSSCYINGSIDLAIGRFPVRNRSDAEIALDKRLHYSEKSTANKGAWQNYYTLVTDDQKGFVYDAEELDRLITSTNPSVLVDKIYTDAYREEHAAGGTRYPEAKKALTYRMNTGSLIVDYIGHGSIFGWAEERIMEVSDAQSYTNYDHLAFLITATCTFSRFDDPVKVSAGEYIFLNPNGGAIGLLTTIRETGSGGNQILTKYFLSNLLSTEGSASIGDACRSAKRQYSQTYSVGHKNQQCFVLLGDPTMLLALPENRVQCTAINHIAVTEAIDTVKALSEVTISGRIEDKQGQIIENFQGKVYAKVFDKQAHLKTLMNDPQYGAVIQFDLWKNMIFNGSGNVKDGVFELTFFVPKDIDYAYGYGRISFFALDTVNFLDATGSFNELLVGGINPNFDVDVEAPSIAVFMNDHQFVSGGVTNQNPILLVDLYDLHGINATGVSVGHDLVAILDHNISSPYLLNNYYQTDQNFMKGTIQYPFYNLSEGEHTITVKAWDSYNNVAEQEITFRVISSQETVVENLYAYPNPMQQYTQFVFEHNHAGEKLQITLQIFDLSGRLITQIFRDIYSSGFRTEPIVWDGTANGEIVKNGIYLYRARIQFQDGTIEQKNNKLLIAR